MTVTTKESRDVIKTVDDVVDEFHAKSAELIPILMKINQELGFISSDALEHISTRMQIPQSQVFSVASFYHMINTNFSMEGRRG